MFIDHMDSFPKGLQEFMRSLLEVHDGEDAGVGAVQVCMPQTALRPPRHSTVACTLVPLHSWTSAPLPLSAHLHLCALLQVSMLREAAEAGRKEMMSNGKQETWSQMGVKPAMRALFARQQAKSRRDPQLASFRKPGDEKSTVGDPFKLLECPDDMVGAHFVTVTYKPETMKLVADEKQGQGYANHGNCLPPPTR